METRSRGCAARSDTQVSRVRTRAQAAAEAAAVDIARSASSTCASTTPPTTPSSRGGRKRTRPVRKSTSTELESAAPNSSSATDSAVARGRDPKRARRSSSILRGARPPNPVRLRWLSGNRLASSGSQHTPRGRASSLRGRSGRGRRGPHRGSLPRSRMDDGPDDNATNSGPNSGGNNRTGAASLQGLLRTLGAGLDDMFPIPHGSSNARVRAVLNTLRTADNDFAKLEALTELCDYLSVVTEETMVSFSVDAFVPPLVKLLNDGTPDLKLLSARAVTHLMDALPSSAALLSHHGASLPLCLNLLSIEYIDLAEQSLSALEKLSADFPHPIVRAGGFSAALSFIDFFSTGVQRVAASIICNLCRSPPADSLDSLAEVLPAMYELVGSEDQRIRESMIHGFLRLADGFRGNSVRLEQLCPANEVLVDKLLCLIVPASPPALSPGCLASAIHLLCTLSRSSPALSMKLLNTAALITKMEERLQTPSNAHSVDFLSLADALLPDVDGHNVIPVSTSARRRRRIQSTTDADVDFARRNALSKEPETLSNLALSLFHPLMQFFVSSADLVIRHRTLSLMCKLLGLASSSLANTLIISKKSNVHGYGGSTFCHFVATLLGENNSAVEIYVGLSLVCSALEKVPRVAEVFLREGVLHELFRLADTEPLLEPLDNSASHKVSGSHYVRNDLHNESTVSTRGMRHSGVRDSYRTRSTLASRQSNPGHRSDSTRRSKNHNNNGRGRTSIWPIPVSSEDINLRARRIVDQFLSSEDNGIYSYKTQSPVLKELIRIHDDLMEVCSGNSTSNGEDELTRFLEKITAETGVTVYEFSRSFFANALHEYLIRSPTTVLGRSERLDVISNLLKRNSSKNAFVSLVRLLNGSLSVEESLPLFNHSPCTLTDSSHDWEWRQLAQPMKLKLCDAKSTDSDSREQSSHIVLIEPFATVRSLEDFLLPRMTSSENPRKRHLSSRCLSRSRDAAVSVDNGVPGGSNIHLQEGNGPMNENDVSEQGEPVRAEIRTTQSSDDEASSESDYINDDYDPEDDISPDDFELGHPLSAAIAPIEFGHDSLSDRISLRLNADTVGASGMHPPREISATTLRSYAAALTGTGRSADHSSRDRRFGIPTSSSDKNSSPPLQFSVNDVRICSDSTIINAVVSSSRVDHNLSSRLWNDVHLVKYWKHGTTSELAVPTGNKGEPSSSNSRALRRSTRLKRCASREKKHSKSRSGDVEEFACVQETFLPLVSSSGFPEIPSLPDLSGSSTKYITLLAYLKWMYDNCDAYEIHQFGECGLTDFLNHKLTSKVRRSVAEPIALGANIFPEWFFSIARHASFLLPFETRRLLFQSTALDAFRSLNLLQGREDKSRLSSRMPSHSQRSPRRESETRLRRIHKHKVRIHRERLLESAMRVMAEHSSSRNILEVEYFGEVGTGLGPTLEFYTSASREVQRLDLNLWMARNEGGNLRKNFRFPSQSSSLQVCNDVGHHFPHQTGSSSSPSLYIKPDFVIPRGDGLFPNILSETEAPHSVLEYFTFIGRLVAKALADGRLLDLRFSPIFYELLLVYSNLLDRDGSYCDELGPYFYSIGFGDLASITKKMSSLNEKCIWKQFCAGRSPLRMLKRIDPELAGSMEKLLNMIDTSDEDTICELGLSFTLPGYDSLELVPNGRKKTVTARNLHEYINRAAYYFLFKGVRKQAEAFVVGFSEVLDIRSLTLIQAHELEMLICGPLHQNWTVEFLIQTTRCDHGFRHESRAVLMLFKVLSELNPHEQRQFVQFVTGSPALPLGGLSNLQPRLTIVKRMTEGNCTPDDCLPTVMTCTNYLKLPDYSNFEIAKRQIMYAIAEGQGSFHLS